jgi:surface polysaccharide O-acyltransferase-like enzyme
VLLLFGFVFSLMEVYFSSHTISPSGIMTAFVNVLEGHTWEHMWYLYVLLGIYLVLPILQKIAPPHPEGFISYSNKPCSDIHFIAA